MPEMTETQAPGRKPKKKKNKESHNAVERHRKEKINAGINRIGNLLPCSQALKQSKNMILDQAFRYITELQKQNDTMLLDGGDKVQAEEIRRLRRQLEELRKESAHYIELLKAHDINLHEDPTSHWKGKQRNAKVAKVTPTHQLPKGIVVYSNGSAMCPAGKQPSPGKQPSETLILQSTSEARLRVNGAVLQVNASSSTPALLPVSAALPTQSTTGLRMIEHCVVETPAAAPSLPPSVSYITLQIPAATTTLAQPTEPTALHTLTVAATTPTESSAVTVSTQPTFTQTVTRAMTSDVVSWVSPDNAIRTVGYTSIPSSQTLLRAGAAGSTQTTWTTLQMAGNTVQPVCQSLPSQEASSATQAVQQVTVCPGSSKPSVHPIQIQMQPNVPLQQATITGPIQGQPIQNPPQLRPAVLNPVQPQAILAAQPRCAVLPQSAIVPQPAVVAHPAVVSQAQPTVLQPASLVPRPPTALIPQPQPLPQPTLVPQAQATVLPLLQTMQVLQVNPAAATASGATASQTTNNPSVVILQQTSACPAPPVVREEVTNQTPCQHIVIIQAPNQAASASQNPQVGMVPAPIPAVSTQTPSTSSTVSVTPLHSVGGKQLVHILPRPVPPQVNHTVQVTQASSSAPVPTTPKTITVNGQVFALQPLKPSDKSTCQGGQSTLQLVQPNTTEEPTTNVALNSLGALSSLNQSISQGLPLNISSQNSCLPPPAPLSLLQQNQQTPPAPAPTAGATLVQPPQQPQVPCVNPVKTGPAVNASKPCGKRLRTALITKRVVPKRTKSAKKKELNHVQPAVASSNTVASGGESQKVQVAVSQVVQSSTVKVTDINPTCTTAATTAQSVAAPDRVTASSSCFPAVLGKTHQEGSKSSTTASQTDSVVSLTTTSSIAATFPTVSATSVKPSISLSTVSKPAAGSGHSSSGSKVSAANVKQSTVSGAADTMQTKSSPTSTVSKQNKMAAASAAPTDSCHTSAAYSTAGLSQVCTSSVTATTPVSVHQTTRTASPCLSLRSKGQDPLPCKKSEPQPTSSSSASTAVAFSSPAPVFSVAHSSVTASSTSSEIRKRPTTPRAQTQQTEMSISNQTLCHPVEVKPHQAPRMNRDAQEERHSSASQKERLVAASDPSRKEFALSQQVYTNLDDQDMEHPLSSGRQTDSPSSAGPGSGRGFSVASMLPQGQSIGAPSSSFGTFTFTSEQAEMLALAMLEQDSPGRRGGGCSGDSVSSSNSTTATWEPPKTPPVSSNKERVLAGQQAKVTKPMDPGTVKPVVEMSVRGQIREGPVSSTNVSRHPQIITYSQSQPVPQAQSQSSSQSGTVTCLSVNNLIRSSSSHQPYPSSPNFAGQQGSVPSPVGTSAHISQPSNNALSPCPGAAQANEYTPLKSSLMRAQPGGGVGERQVKIISKRQAQEEVMINTGKRPKPCPQPTNIVSHMEVKAPDHSQIMVGQLPSTSSTIMARINSESGSPLFSTNSFMSPAVHPTEAHCPAQGPPEQSQVGVLHLTQGHPQHAVNQTGQHLGGNLYMKQQQQQQEQQRHQLYHLQHHLTQPDPAQRHSLHQRALQQQQQEQQHVQKKRGLVRGSQTGSPAGMQPKQHHMEKSGVQQHSHQQQTQHQQRTQQQSQQHPQQSHQQSQQHQQPAQHQQSHPQQHQQQAHQQPPQAQHQQQHQQQQQLQQQQSSHSRHQQHLQQQIQQQQHFRHQDKSCEAQGAGSRAHHSSHMAQQDHLKSGQDHNAMQRMMNSRGLEQQLISPSSNPVSRSSELACAPSRQERHRVSNYSAEALIGKSSTSGEQQQRMALHLQPGRGAAQEQQDLRGYLDTSRGKASIAHNPQSRLPSEHPGSDVQHVSECPPFKAMGGGGGAHQLGGFEAQVSRGSDMAPKTVPPSQRGPQGQQQGGFRMNVGPSVDGRNRGGYSGAHSGLQGVQVGPAQDGCHQSFMQSLLSPHLPEQTSHQRAVQCCPPVSMEYSCVPGSSSGDIQAKASSPSVPQSQKAPAMRLAESNKGHISQVNSNMHQGPGVRTGLPHPPPPHSSSEPGRTSAPSRPPTAVSQHSRHIARDTQPTKLRPGDRPRSGTLRTTNPFEPDGHLPLPSGGGVLLSRPQSGGETRRSTIVRLMADNGQVPGDNNLVADQHLTQNFGFPFISEGGMNPPPPINANSTFIPPVSQPSTSRTPSLLPVEPQNTLPSFYPSYSPAAHPSLPSDVTLQYFPNQMFTSPSADKGSAPPLNNRFGSILSPPRPVGFGQASFPLLPDMPPMPIANSSGITPHISNFSLTSLFPEIATGMPTDGSAMPMSPLLSLSNTSSADSGKQPNRPAHNISHILGHDGTSAV